MSKLDLSKLSKEEKLQLLDEIEEKEKRLKRTRPPYKPNSLQEKVHKSQKRQRFVFSGNGSGKSALATMETYWAASGTHPHRVNLPVPNTGVLLLDSPDKVQRYLDEFNKFYDTSEWSFNKRGKPYINEIIIPNGSVIDIMFFQQDSLAFESKELDYLIIDEPCDRRVYIALQRGLRRVENAFTLFVGTPLAQPWLMTDVWNPWVKGEKTDIECFRGSSDVNAANLGANYLTNFASDLTEKEKKIRLEGQFAMLDGLALADLWKADIHTIERFDWPRGWPVVCSIDFHGAKSTTALLLGVNKLDEFYVIKTMASKSPPSQFAQELKDFYKGFKVSDVLCDSLGASPRTGGYQNDSFIQVLQKEGVPVRSTSFKEKSNDAWVTNIRDLLRVRKTKLGPRPGIYIFNDLLQIISEFETVQWARNKITGEPYNYLEISNQDMLSCLKYALAAPPMLNKIAKVYTRPKPSYASRK